MGLSNSDMNDSSTLLCTKTIIKRILYLRGRYHIPTALYRNYWINIQNDNDMIFFISFRYNARAFYAVSIKF